MRFMSTSPQPSETSLEWSPPRPVGDTLPAPLFPQQDAHGPGTPLREYLNALRHHGWRIGVLTLLVGVLVGLYELRQPKQYQAHALVRLDPNQGGSAVDNAATPLQVDASTLIATEIEEARSDAVLIPVVLQLHLDHQDALNYRPGANPADTVSGVSEKLLDAVRNYLSVTRPPDTYLLDIGFTSRSPELSAQVANALGEALIAHEYATRSQALLASSRYLTAQANDLRAS